MPLFRTALTLFWVVATTAAAQDQFHYRDGRGGPIVTLPYGSKSFADEATFEPANLRTGENRNVPSEATGAPNREFVSLGCGAGTLVLGFTDNFLIDVPGPDLYVFEFGPVREATEVEISQDRLNWVAVGRAEGATVGIDIAGNTGEYRYVRLTNLSSSCNNETPGADIDAVAAIGAGRVDLLTSVEDSVLFDFGQANLRSTATPQLEALAAAIERYDPARVFIVGHTDSIGSDAANLDLSSRRAETVRAYLTARHLNTDIMTSAFGEFRPIASNDTDEGRARNRRVEVLVVPR